MVERWKHFPRFASLARLARQVYRSGQMRAVFHPVILELGGAQRVVFFKAARFVSISKKTCVFGVPLCTDVTL